MPKIVVLKKKIEKGFCIRNFMTGGQGYEDVFIWENDIIKDFSYLDKNKEIIETISGRLSNVLFSINNRVTDKNEPNKIANRVTLNGIVVDTSTEYNSSMIMIPKASILEYKASGSVDDTDALPLVRVRLNLLMSDKTTVEILLEEGSEFYSTIFNAETKPAIVIGNFTVDGFVYNMQNSDFDITGAIFKSENGKKYTVDFSDIKNFGKKGLFVGKDEEDIIDAIQNAAGSNEIGGVILQGESKVNDPINLDGSLILEGYYADTPANYGTRCNDDILDQEDLFTGLITCGKDTDIVLNGLTFSNEALVLTEQPKSLTIKNCKFVNMASEGKSYMIMEKTFNDTPTKVIIENCYFGNNAYDDTNSIYNLFEGRVKLADGSSISNNYFAKACCTHNIINIYDVEKDASINIENNIFEYSANAIRFGCVGNPSCTINIIGNTYEETDMLYPDYAGLLLIQPYGTQTESYENVDINLTNTKGPEGYDGQLYYIYCGSSDTQLTEQMKPSIFIDGVLQ